MLRHLIGILKKQLGMTKAQPLGRANLSETDSFDTLPTPWPIAQVEEEEDPKVI